MVFNSFEFFAFFAVVLPLALVLRARVDARNRVLLVASYVFYASWNWRLVGLLALTSCSDYLIARRLGEARGPRTARDRGLVAASASVDLGILGVFKYYDFFAGSAGGVLAWAGIHAAPPLLHVVLPVGISFYTFQSMGYVIDVYRGRIAPERRLRDYLLYVSFFPQLVAGPIERSRALLPQLATPRSIDWSRFSSGLGLIGWGLFEKVVLADNLARWAVDPAFAMSRPDALWVLLGVYGFAVQIYCDFAGYTDIARGVARAMGFELMRNFAQPYLATNPSEFWRRWHISFSTWLRDYLYVPLGGNRRGRRRTYVNLMITMLLGGLWHGAGWTWVLWGAFHGVLLCLHHAVRRGRGDVPRPTSPAAWAWLLVRAAAFFQVTCLGWLVFRARSVAQVGTMLRALGGGFPAVLAPPAVLAAWVVALAGTVVFVADLARYASADDGVVLRLPVPLRAAVYAAGLLAFVTLGNFGGRAFIYFQF